MFAAFLERYRLLTATERRAWIMLSALAVVTVVLETAMGGLVYASIAYLSRPSSAQYSTIMGFIVDRLPGTTPYEKSIAFLVLLGVVHLLKATFQILVGQVRLRLATETSFSLSWRLFDLYLAAPYSFHLSRHSAVLQNHVFGNTAHILSILNGGVSLATQALTIAGLLAVVIKVSPWTSVLTALAIGVVLVVFLRLTKNLQRVWAKRQEKLAVAAYRDVRHGLGAFKELKVVGREGFFGRAFRRDRLASLDLTIKQASLTNLPRMMIEGIFGIGVLVAVVYGTGRDAGGIVPLLSLYAYVGIRAIPAANGLVNEIGAIRRYIVLTEPVLADLRTLGGPADLAVAPPGPRTARVELRNVRFSYPRSSQAALDDVSLIIQPGEMVGVVGASGAGKTTLGDLILGLHRPESGSILVDGVEATGNMRAQLRTAYVPQNVFVMDDTVRRNIAFGLDDEAIDEARVATAVDRGRLRAFVDSLPTGLDARLGEQGARCSGGERQRIAIARALYDDPHLVVLDEATSALDPATEKDILRSLESVKGRMALIVISHRLSTVARCDRVIVLRAGKVVAQGSFEDLSRTSEDFRAWAGLEDEDLAPPAQG